MIWDNGTMGSKIIQVSSQNRGNRARVPQTGDKKRKEKKSGSL